VPWLVSFSIIGLGLAQARIVSAILGGLLLVVIIAIGKQNYSLLTGVLSALLLALSPTFTQASHYVRPDIFLAFVVTLGYCVGIIAHNGEKSWAHLLAGLLFGISLDIHQNALLFTLGFAVLYLVKYKLAILRSKGAWLFTFGWLLGILYYLIAYVFPDPQNYLKLFEFELGGSHQLPILQDGILGLLTSIRQEVGRFHFYDNNLDFAVIGASIAFLAIRRTQADRRLLLFCGAVFAGFVLIVGNKHDVYAILLYPFLMLMVAETLISLTRTTSASLAQRVFSVAMIFLMLINGAQHLERPIGQHWNYDYYSITERIRTVIPSGARIMGLPTWWLGLA
jgi:4-amino-4-deoxy-L-arabinose transferase-like glycosyltransferase